MEFIADETRFRRLPETAGDGGAVIDEIDC
jgi:hypothetical protein